MFEKYIDLIISIQGSQVEQGSQTIASASTSKWMETMRLHSIVEDIVGTYMKV